MLVGVMGKMGGGKTRFMTIMGVYMHKMTGAPLYANYSLFGVPYTRINSLKELWEINNGIVLLDELWLSMDARMWKDNVAVTRFINQTRKKKITLFFTTQHIKQVELRTRNATDVLVFAEKGNTVTFIDYQYMEIGRKFIFPSPELFNVLYDTYETLQPMDMSDAGIQLEERRKWGGGGRRKFDGGGRY